MIYTEHTIKNMQAKEIAYVEESKLNYYVTVKKISWEFPYIIAYKVPKKLAKTPQEAYEIASRKVTLY